LREFVGGSDYVKLEKRHEVKYAFPTYQKSIEILDYEDRTPLRDGLQKMWDWAQKQPRRERFTWHQYELEKGIYKFWKKD
jgi:UDP-glucose 4-epimerase